MEPNKLEQQFREKLEQRTIQPSKMAWDRLDAMLSVSEEKEEPKVLPMKRDRSWMYVAASVVVFTLIGAFFLTRETGSGNTPDGAGTSIVNTEKPVEAEGNNGTVQQATDNVSAPEMKQEAVATTQVPATGRTAKAQRITTGGQKSVNNNTIAAQTPSTNESVAIAQEKPKENVVNAADAEKLLAVSVTNANKKKATIKVDAGSLLSSVEGELDESFRDKAFDGVVKNFNAVKTAVVNRNYE